MGVSKGPWTVNGLSPLGHRIDALGEGHEGLAFVENPVGFIKKRDDADYTCAAVNEREGLTKKLDRVGVLFQELVTPEFRCCLEPVSQAVDQWIDRLSMVLKGDPTVTVHCEGNGSNATCIEFEVPLDEFIKPDTYRLPHHDNPNGELCHRSGTSYWRLVLA